MVEIGPGSQRHQDGDRMGAGGGVDGEGAQQNWIRTQGGSVAILREMAMWLITPTQIVHQSTNKARSTPSGLLGRGEGTGEGECGVRLEWAGIRGCLCTGVGVA